MIPYRTLSLQIITLTTIVSRVAGTPLFLVESGRPQCRITEVPKETYIKIFYDAPDIPVPVNKEAKDYGPTYLQILEKPTQAELDSLNLLNEKDREEMVVKRKDKKKLPPGKSRSIELEANKGHIHHRVEEDSEVHICIRASRAGGSNQMRFGFRVAVEGDEKFSSMDAAPNSLDVPGADVDKHLSFLEEQMKRIESQMHSMLNEADLGRQRDSIYHAKTDAMNKATIFWPIVHVGILLVTGFTQANHIVQFFKKRRII